MVYGRQNKVVRCNLPVAPFENPAHLIRPRNPLLRDPFPQTRHGHTADFISSLVEREFALGYEIGELHSWHIPHNGEYRQPRFGEGRLSAKCGKLPIMGNRLRELRKSFGLTHEAAAERTGMSRSQFIKLERGERRLTSDYIQQIAQGLGVSAAEIISEVVDNVENIPIVGMAGAGPDGTVLFAHGDGGLGFGPPSPNSTEATKALEVRGDSMRGIASDGWLVYFEDDRLSPTEELIGELCVVGLEDDRVLVKVLQPGRGDGLFDLESFNAPVLRDVPVRWACLVTAIIPRKPARKLIREREPRTGQ